MSSIGVALVGKGLSAEVFFKPFLVEMDEFNLLYQLDSKTSESEIDKILADNNVELVIISTPNKTHFSWAQRVLRANKNVLIEKPFVTKLEDGEKLIEEEKKSKGRICVFQNRRFDGDFLTAKKLIEDKSLGALNKVYMSFNRFKPQTTNHWRESSEWGNGVLFDLGPHLIDQALHLFGAPTEILTDKRIQRVGAQALDYFYLIFKYENLTVHLESGCLCSVSNPKISLQGDQGSYTKFSLDPQEKALKEKKSIFSKDWGVTQEKGKLLKYDPGKEGFFEDLSHQDTPGDYKQFFKSLSMAILEQSPMPISASEGLASTKMLLKVLEF